MGGRNDYYERREERKEKYKELAQKAKSKSEEYANSDANKILLSTLGQPIIIGHHSENMARRLHKKASNDMEKSIQEYEKSNYYLDKIENIENSNVIYNDDPNAIEKLNMKLEQLEREREYLKSIEHEQYQLQNLGARIREIKKRIFRLERLEKIEFEDKEFYGGRIIHNKEINRIQILFDSIPSAEIRDQLKHRGFHWSRREKSWQREFNEQTIKSVNILMKDVLNKEQEDEEMEELE